MRSLLLIIGLGLAAASSSTATVPSFVRQTGLTCNQCHVTYGAPVPNFTYTGKKFRMTGYRAPFTAQKIDAGEEGALNGARLAMSLSTFLSFRFQSVLAARSRAPGASEWGDVTSNPTSRFSFFPVGAFGDYLGLWSELYATPDGSDTEQWGQGLFSFDEYDLRFTVAGANGTSALGMAITNQSAREIGGFGPWPVGVTDFFNGGTWRGWAHPNRGVLALYGFFNDLVFVMVGAGPGDDNLSWERSNLQGQIAIAPLHSDARELWLVSTLQLGNDGIPLVTTFQPSRDGTMTWEYEDNIAGIAATRTGPNTGAPYLSVNMGDFLRSTTEIRYGFSDRGPHSMELNARLSLNKETYSDGAQVEVSAIGSAVRYAFNHTWGLDLVLDQPFTYRFTEANGTAHDIDIDLSYTTYLSFRPAMNLLVYLSYLNSHGLSMDSPVETGNAWSLALDLLF